MVKIYVNMDANFISEFAETNKNILSDAYYARLVRIADNVQRMDERLMNLERFDEEIVLTRKTL